MIISGIPTSKDPLALFEYSVRRVISLGMMGDSNTHQAWATLIFKYERKSFVRSELMSIVKREYSKYFNEELQYKFLEDKIRTNFPYLFGIEDSLNLFDRMLQALDAECTEQKDPRNRKMYRVASCDTLSSQDGKFVYKAQLVVEEGDDPHFSEGMPVDFRIPKTIYICEVVDYDYANALLFFSSSRQIYFTHDARVVSDATMNTEALMKLLQDISSQKIEEKLPLYKFINGTTQNISNVDHARYPSYLDGILSKDKSQFEAFQAALDKDITFS